jgi:hypothetical protein
LAFIAENLKAIFDRWQAGECLTRASDGNFVFLAKLLSERDGSLAICCRETDVEESGVRVLIIPCADRDVRARGIDPGSFRFLRESRDLLSRDVLAGKASHLLRIVENIS